MVIVTNTRGERVQTGGGTRKVLSTGNVTPYTPQMPTTPAPSTGFPYPTTPGLSPDSAANEMIAQVRRFAPSSLKTRDPIPSTAISSPVTTSDVLRKRSDYEAQMGETQAYNSLTEGADQPPQKGQIGNIDGLLMKVMNPEQTEAERAQMGLLDESVNVTRDYYSGLTQRNESIRDKYGVDDANSALSQTKVKKAKLQAEMRENLRKFDTTSHGVAREFSQDQRKAIESEYTFELANLSIIELAQQGNLENARALAKDVIDEQFSAYEGQTKMLEAQLKLLDPILGKEAEQRKTKLNFLIQERTRLLTEARQDEMKKYEVLTEAATNGADQATLDRIKKGSLGEAYLVAGPYLGKLDRDLKKAQIANQYDQIKQRAEQAKETNFANRKNALELAEKGDPEAIKFLGYDPTALPGGVAGAKQYESQKTDIEMGIDAAQRLLGNTSGLKLSTGAFQSPFLAAAATSIGTGIAGGAAIGTAVPGVGTVGGAAAGLATGIAATPVGYSMAKTNKDEFLAAASYLINDVTFQSIIDLRAQGVTFGQMTEGERIAAGRAASQLASAAITDVDGTVKGFRGSDETIRKYVDDILVAYEGRMEYLNMQHGITLDEQTEAQNLWGVPN